MSEAIIFAWLIVGLIGAVVLHSNRPILWDSWGIAIALGLITLALALWERNNPPT